MPVISATRGVPQGTDIAIQSALPLVGSASRQDLQDVLNSTDAALARLHEDRNVLLTDGGLITFTGTDVQFTEDLKLTLNSKVAGGAPTVINLGSSTVSLASSGDIWYAVVNRAAGTATTSVASSLPAVTSTNVEVFLIAKRVDAGDGTQRLYFRTGTALNAGQTVRLGASGAGGAGSGTGDDLGNLLFKGSFTDRFEDTPTSSLTSVDSSAGKTDPTAYSATKALYKLNYDASLTVTGTGTSMTLSAAPSFTPKAGDVLVVGAEVKRVTAYSAPTSLTIESAFSSNPTAAACTVSQAVHTKDIYGFAADGLSLSASFSGASFSEILVDYEDTSTLGDGIFDINVAPVVAYSASLDGTTYSGLKLRPTLTSDEADTLRFSSAGTALYLRFFANKASGSGSVNLLGYKTFVQKDVTAASGGVTNSAYCVTNGAGTEVNCLAPFLFGGKTRIQLTFEYGVGINAGEPYGSLDVYLNGQLIPRYIDAVLTPDASYLEISPNTIELDTDYSGADISVEIVQRNKLLDAVTVGTTNSNYLVLSDGTVSLPSLSFNADSDTGLYHPTANSIAMTAGGAKVWEASALGSFPYLNVQSYSSGPVALDISASVVLVNATSGAITVTLPTPTKGKVVHIKKSDSSANIVTISASSGTIDGTATKPLYFQYDCLSIVSDGTNYFII